MTGKKSRGLSMCVISRKCWQSKAYSAQGRVLLALLGIFWGNNFISTARGETPQGGIIVAIPSNLESEQVKKLRNAILERLDQFQAAAKDIPPGQKPVFKIILDMNPGGKAAVSEFGPAYDLSIQIRQMKNRGSVILVAWVHGEVKRHAVLPVLSCDGIYFSSQGKLGKIVGESGEFLSNTIRAAYEEMTAGRISKAVVAKMYNPDLTLVRSRQANGAQVFVDRAIDAQGEIVVQAGAEGFYDFAMARTLGIAEQEPADSLDQLCKKLRLPRQQLEELSGGNDPDAPWRIVLTGNIDADLIERFKRRVHRAEGSGANILFLQLECSGGTGSAASELADYLAELRSPQREKPVRLIAFVSPHARDLALFPALACSRIVMAEGASLGGMDDWFLANPGQEGEMEKKLQELLQARGYPKEEAEAFAKGWTDPAVRIALGVNRTTGESRIFLADQLEKMAEWKLEILLKPFRKEEEGQRFKMSAELAADPRIHLAQRVVKDMEQLAVAEGFKSSKIPLSGTDWLDDLADFLRHPWTSVMLVMIGVTCLIMEVKIPGASLPGIIAALCFVLFFWSHSQLAGQVLWLGVLLFILGLFLVGLEVFVLPGFGVTGLAGILLVLGSLGLVAFGHWPRSSDEWSGFARTIGPYGLSFLAAIGAAMLLARYLPSIPGASRLFLFPKTPRTAPSCWDSGPGQLEIQGGMIGVAETTLHPSGMARFGEQWVDVVSEGDFIEAGSKIEVIHVEGNRIVVKHLTS